MKKFVLLLATLFLLACGGSDKHIEYSRINNWEMPQAQPKKIERKAPTKKEYNSKIHWRDGLGINYIDKAIKEEKSILVFFYNDWCPYCKKMVKETFTSDPIITLVNRRYYAFRVNVEYLSDRQRELLGIDGVPKIMVLTPDEDMSKSEINYLHGFQDADTTFLFLLKTTK